MRDEKKIEGKGVIGYWLLEKNNLGSSLFYVDNRTGDSPGMVSFCCAKLFEGLSDRFAGQPLKWFY